MNWITLTVPLRFAAAIAVTAGAARAQMPSPYAPAPLGYGVPAPMMPYAVQPPGVSPGYPAGYGAYTPAVALPPQLGGPAISDYPAGAQTCVSPIGSCPASAPNTPGLPCSCPDPRGNPVEGIVH